MVFYRVVLWCAVLSITFSNFVMAQTPVWIQIEPRPSLLEIEDRARAYSAKLPNINAFSLGSGWYVIAMGPFSEEIAAALAKQCADAFVLTAAGGQTQ